MSPLSTTTKAVIGWAVILLLIVALEDYAGAQPCVQPPAGLVSWWPADGDALDIADGHDGTLQGGATFAAGKVGQAFSFDGVDGMVATSLLLPSIGTIELWVNPTSLAIPSSTQILASTHGMANGDDRLWIVSSGPEGGPGVAPNTLVINLGSCCTNDIVIANPLSVGTWTHLALTFDYTADVYQLFVNGVFVATSTAQRSAPTQAFHIGGGTSDFGQNFFFHGAIDEVAIYDRVLGAGEIQSIVAGGSAGKCKPSVGGSVTGVSLTKVKCTNLTSKQSVSIQDPGTSWDCEAAGLVVRPGDRIKMEVQGTAN